MNTVADEEFRRGDAHDDDCLDHLHHREGYLIEDLNTLPSDKQHGDENGDDRREDGVVARQKRDQYP